MCLLEISGTAALASRLEVKGDTKDMFALEVVMGRELTGTLFGIRFDDISEGNAAAWIGGRDGDSIVDIRLWLLLVLKGGCKEGTLFGIRFRDIS